MSGVFVYDDDEPMKKKVLKKTTYKKPNTTCKFCKSKYAVREVVTGLQALPHKTRKVGSKLWHPVCEDCIKSRKWEMTLETRNISLEFDQDSIDRFLRKGPMVSGLEPGDGRITFPLEVAHARTTTPTTYAKPKNRPGEVGQDE